MRYHFFVLHVHTLHHAAAGFNVSRPTDKKQRLPVSPFIISRMRIQREIRRTTVALITVLLVLSGCSTIETPPAISPVVSVPAPQYAPQTMDRLEFAEARRDFAPYAPVGDRDLWQRVRRGFVMADMNSPRLQEQELWYANRPDYIKRFVERGSRYLYHIVEEVERRGLPTEIVLLPIIESAFNPQAYSRAHASGMWQFIPSTGKIFGLKQDWMTDNRRDVLLSTDAALDYLSKLYGMFNDWELAFAAYNCGEGCVGRAIANNQRRGLPTDFASLNLPKETRSYVPKLIAVKNIILSPESYGISLPTVENRPYFIQVVAPEKIDVKLAARLAEMPEEDFAQLNPSFNKPVAASGSGFFLVPTEKAATFKTNLDLYRSLNGPMVSWATITAKSGQSVDAVARSHGMTASYLRATNGPFKERKGKFTQPVTFMAPNQKDALAITAAFDRKVILKREQRLGSAGDGDDGPVIVSNVPRENLRLVSNSPANTTAKAVDAPLAPAAETSKNLQKAAVASAPRETTTYVVQKGDTLFSIAKRSQLPLEELKTLNQLSANAVRIGQTLKVRATDSFIDSVIASPVPTGANTASVSTAPAKNSVAAKSSPNAGRFHTVRSGDTLFAIAKRANTTVDNLLAWNRLRGNSVLQTGLRLKLSP